MEKGKRQCHDSASPNKSEEAISNSKCKIGARARHRNRYGDGGVKKSCQTTQRVRKTGRVLNLHKSIERKKWKKGLLVPDDSSTE